MTSASALTMKIVGALSIVAGGLVAAVASPLNLSYGSWTSAYLVLVAGVAQYAMGQARLTWTSGGHERFGWTQLALWMLGNTAVIVGTVTAAVWLVLAGSVLLLAGLVFAFIGTLAAKAGIHRVVLWGYRALLVLLVVSIPVGMVLSVIRNT